MKFVKVFKLLLLIIAALVLQSTAAAQIDGSRDEKWRADVRFYAAELPKLHKNLFFHLSKAEFARETENLAKRVPQLSDNEIAVELMRITALVGDGHTLSTMPAAGMNFFSFRLEHFKEGWFVTQAADEYKQVLGARLVKIGDTKVEKAERNLKKLISADNEFARTSRLSFFFVWASVLQTSGVLKNAENGVFTFRDGNGKMLSVEARPIPINRFLTARLRELADEGQAPSTAKNSLENYWFEYLPAARTIYLAYNKCENAKNKQFADFVKEIFAVADAQPVERLVIDLRRNAGGDSGVIKSLYTELGNRPMLLKKGRLFVLTSSITFSSAFKNALEMRNRYNALWVGESPGQKPNAYGEVRRFALPNSKLNVQYSTKFWEEMKGSDLAYLSVDIPVTTRFADYRRGHDPALEAALNYIAR